MSDNFFYMMYIHMLIRVNYPSIYFEVMLFLICKDVTIFLVNDIHLVFLCMFQCIA